MKEGLVFSISAGVFWGSNLIFFLLGFECPTQQGLMGYSILALLRGHFRSLGKTICFVRDETRVSR